MSQGCPHLCYRQVFLQQLYYCTENRLAEKPTILKQPEQIQNCSQSKLIIKSADPKDNVIKTSAKSQD